MSIQPDHWIRKMALEHGMIDPFVDGQVRDGVISYGLSSFGYDIRIANEFRIFTPGLGDLTVVDPKQFDARSMVDFHGDVCVIPPNSFILARTVEYFRIPRNVLTVCLGKSTYARCFSGDTQVALVDGTSPTLEEMARRADDGELFWGYSVGQYGRIVVTLLDAPRFIGRDSLLEVTLDDGGVIRATPDHQFISRDGQMVEAGQLRPGDALLPLYRQVARGYEMVFQPLSGQMLPTHRLADEWNVRNGAYLDLPGTHRHHIDINRRNNNPWNLMRMEASEHIRLHNSMSYGEKFDPEDHSLAIREAFERLSQDPEWRAQFSQAQSARAHSFWHDDAYIEQRAALDETGSIRGAARLLECDRAVFRRFPEVLDAFRGRHITYRNHRVQSVRQLPGDHDVFCLTVPEAGNFALESGVFVSNCGLIVNVTPFEPEWEGYVTLEISNTTPLPAKVYAHEGIAQVLFFQGDPPEKSYADKKGKYQGQAGITLPKL